MFAKKWAVFIAGFVGALLIIKGLLKHPRSGWRYDAIVGAVLFLASQLCTAQTWQSPYAVHVEGSAGVNFYDRGPDGLWIQDAFHHDWEPTAPAFKIGLTGDLWAAQSWGVAWHADYAWLGMTRSDSMATPVDANYNASSANGCNGACLPLADFKGSGHDYGFLLTIEPYVNVGEWRFGVEAGPWIHHNQWTEDISGWQANGTGPVQSLHVTGGGGWNVGYAAGLTLHYRSIDAELLYFASKPQRTVDVPPIWVNSIALFVGTRF